MHLLEIELVNTEVHWRSSEGQGAVLGTANESRSPIASHNLSSDQAHIVFTVHRQENCPR